MAVQLGRQVLAELSFCDPSTLNDAEALEALLRTAAADSGATLIKMDVHRFQPYGMSGVAILAESHLAVHTWPELGYAAVDAFTCGDHVNPDVAVRVLSAGFRAQSCTTMQINRGMHLQMPVNRAVHQDQQESTN
jgi:S-adenosylmethionine decarboxylase